MIERRALVRHKTFFKGRIYFNNRLSSMDCIVRDATASGGRLEVSDSVTLPNAFEIYLPNKDEYFHAKVEWRKRRKSRHKLEVPNNSQNNNSQNNGTSMTALIMLSPIDWRNLSIGWPRCKNNSMHCKRNDRRPKGPLRLYLPRSFTAR